MFLFVQRQENNNIVLLTNSLRNLVLLYFFMSKINIMIGVLKRSNPTLTIFHKNKKQGVR